MLEKAKQTVSARYKQEYRPSYKSVSTAKGILGASRDDKTILEDKNKLEQKLDAHKVMRQAKGVSPWP